MRRNATFISVFTLGTLALATILSCQQPSRVTLTASASEPGIEIPADFLGVSLESETILPDSHGRYPMFRPTNRPLIVLFHTLGIGSLRIGGNTADRPEIKVPDERDIDELFRFAKNARVRIIYTLRLKGSAPLKDIDSAQYIMGHYAAELACIAIGNEPDVFEKDYDRYSSDVNRYFNLIGRAVPGVKFCGPGTTGTMVSSSSWPAQFVRSFGKAVPILWITQHEYPASYGSPTTDLKTARVNLLGPSVLKQTETDYAAFGPSVRSAGFKFRLEEANSDFRMGGTEGVNDSFASALWGLDFLYWWATHGAQGVNFHTGDTVAVKGGDGPCIYAVFHTNGDGYDVRPLAYAMKAFDLTGHGRLLKVAGGPINNVSTYAVAGDDGNLYFTLIYKALNQLAPPIQVGLNPGPGFAAPETMLLSSPNSDPGATKGITLGGAEIDRNGLWSGHWLRAKDGSRRDVELTPGTALLVRFRPSK